MLEPDVVCRTGECKMSGMREAPCSLIHVWPQQQGLEKGQSKGQGWAHSMWAIAQAQHSGSGVTRYFQQFCQHHTNDGKTIARYINLAPVSARSFTFGCRLNWQNRNMQTSAESLVERSGSRPRCREHSAHWSISHSPHAQSKQKCNVTYIKARNN